MMWNLMFEFIFTSMVFGTTPRDGPTRHKETWTQFRHFLANNWENL
jgi:hypothetical protein